MCCIQDALGDGAILSVEVGADVQSGGHLRCVRFPLSCFHCFSDRPNVNIDGECVDLEKALHHDSSISCVNGAFDFVLLLPDKQLSRNNCDVPFLGDLFAILIVSCKNVVEHWYGDK